MRIATDFAYLDEDEARSFSFSSYRCHERQKSVQEPALQPELISSLEKLNSKSFRGKREVSLTIT